MKVGILIQKHPGFLPCVRVRCCETGCEFVILTQDKILDVVKAQDIDILLTDVPIWATQVLVSAQRETVLLHANDLEYLPEHYCAHLLDMTRKNAPTRLDSILRQGTKYRTEEEVRCLEREVEAHESKLAGAKSRLEAAVAIRHRLGLNGRETQNDLTT